MIQREESLGRLQVRARCGRGRAGGCPTAARGDAGSAARLWPAAAARLPHHSAPASLVSPVDRLDPAARPPPLPACQVSLGGDRVLPLAAFRGTTRPVILAGSRGQLSRALAGAEPYREALRERGVSVVPIQLSSEDAGERLRQLKAEFGGAGGGEAGGAAAGGAAPKGFGAAPDAKADGGKAKAAGTAAAGLSSKDRKWQLKAADEAEWAAWLAEQKRAAGIQADAVYVQVQLDGSVRSSGVGAPSWQQLVDDLPELDSVRTKLTDGVAGM